MNEKTHTRFIFAMSSLVLTMCVLAFGSLSPGGQVAAFSFLGTVALGFGVAKYAEHNK